MGSRETFKNQRDAHFEDLEKEERERKALEKKKVDETVTLVRAAFLDGEARFSD